MVKNNSSKAIAATNHKKNKFTMNKLIVIIMLIATIALYVTTIIYAVIAK